MQVVARDLDACDVIGEAESGQRADGVVEVPLGPAVDRPHGVVIGRAGEVCANAPALAAAYPAGV